jgi:dihydroorotate dehydrogenase electron transfer subunit
MSQDMQILIHRCELLEIDTVADGWHRLKLYAPGAAHAEPGQFIHLRAGSGLDPLLRRPFSIHFADEQTHEIWLLIREVGNVTARLARLQPGVTLDLLGPLGSGFPAPVEAEKAMLVAGGIGLAPLYFLSRRYRVKKLPFDLIIGGTSGSALPENRFFSQDGLLPLVATDDGSRGFKGTATDLLEQQLRLTALPARIYACGPLPMLARVAELGREYGVPTYISLESVLACAVGACLGCVFPFKSGGVIEYRRVCRDGPVFNGEEACFERS